MSVSITVTYERVVRVPGLGIPVFKHDLDYRFCDLPVFADGLIGDLEPMDLTLLREKIVEGEITTRVPQGETLWVHDLGSFTVHAPRWLLRPDALHAWIERIVRELNPSIRGLYDSRDRSPASERGYRVLRPRSIWEVPRGRGTRARGKSRPIFHYDDSRLSLAKLRVFSDGAIEVGSIPRPERVALRDLPAALRDGWLRTQAREGERVHIMELGSFVTGKQQHAISHSELIRELEDMIDLANHRPDSIARCRRALETYRRHPSRARREALRDAYEAIPLHHRAYLGDMDTKDSEVRLILYGEDD